MHILWINKNADFAGGCEQYCANTADILAENGHTNSLLYDAGLPASHSFLSHFHHAFPLSNVAQQIIDCAPDIIYIHQLDSIPVLSACTDSLVPVVCFFHDHRLFCLREHKYTALRRLPCAKPVGFRCYPCFGWIAKGKHGLHLRSLHSLRTKIHAYKNVDMCIVGSRYMAEHVAAHGFLPTKIHTVPLFAPLPDKNNSHSKIQRDSSLVLFIGQCVRGKGIDILIRAAKKMTVPCHFILIGEGAQKSAFKKYATRCGLENKFSFIDSCSQKKLDDYYRRARCIVLPSRAETFGLIGPESMRYATPAVASDTGGISEWLSHEKNGLLVPPCNPDALAKALTTLLTHDACAESYGAAAQKEYFARFTPDIHYAQLIKLLHSLIIEPTS